MANLFDYISWRGDIPFEQVPFNKIDAQILALLAYSMFDSLVSSEFDQRMTFEQYNQKFKNCKDYKKRCENPFLQQKKSAELIDALAKSIRFKDVMLCGYENRFDKYKVEQFAAITFIVQNQPIVAFRGTDDSITGWREDFNSLWLDVVPAQSDAIEYFERAVQFFNKKLIILGHSKAGNLALNTAVKCGKKCQSKILKVYNFDGPGFPKTFFDSKEFKAIEDRVVSVYPEFCVVGMMLYHPQKFQITKSDGFAGSQHDLLTWQVLGSDFESAQEFNNKSLIFHNAINEWVNRLDKDSKQKFVTSMFDVLDATGFPSILEIGDNAIQSAVRMVAKYSSFDKQTKAEIKSILKLFRAVVKEGTSFAKILNFQNIASKFTKQKETANAKK